MRGRILGLAAVSFLIATPVAAEACDQDNTPSSRVESGPHGTTYIFHEANGDTEIVHPDGSVTTILHDPDCTKTIVDPNGGVRVETERDDDGDNPN